MERAGASPPDRLMALIEADFQAEACGPDALPIWFAFWGELRFSGTYAEVAEDFDARRQQMLARIWAELLPEADQAEAVQMAEWTETLTDGYWQRLYLAPDSFDRAAALQATRAFLNRMLG